MAYTAKDIREMRSQKGSVGESQAPSSSANSSGYTADDIRKMRMASTPQTKSNTVRYGLSKEETAKRLQAIGKSANRRKELLEKQKQEEKAQKMRDMYANPVGKALIDASVDMNDRRQMQASQYYQDLAKNATTSDDAIVKAYELIPDYNIVERALPTKEGKRKQQEYANKQAIAGKYNAIKDSEVKDRLEKAGYSMDDILSWQSIMADPNTSEEELQKTMNKENALLNGGLITDKEYLDLLNNLQADALKETSSDPVGDSMYTAIVNPWESGIHTIESAANYITGKPIEKSNTATNAIRESVLENNIGDDHKVGQWLYQQGMSGADNMIAYGANMGVNNLGSAALGLEKASSVIDESLEQGYSPMQVAMKSVLSGVSTAITEGKSMEYIMDEALKGVGASLLKEMLAEGTQEVVESLIDTLADIGVASYGGTFDKNAITSEYNSYVESGMSESDAAWKTFGNYMLGLLNDFVGGAVMGGVMGGATNVITSAGGANNATSDNYTEVAKNLVGSKEAVKQLANSAVNILGEDSNTANILTGENAKTAENLTADDVAMILSELSNNGVEGTESVLVNTFMEMGESKSQAKSDAKVITKMLMQGENVNAVQEFFNERALEKNENLSKVYADVLNQKIDTSLVAQNSALSESYRQQKNNAIKQQMEKEQAYVDDAIYEEADSIEDESLRSAFLSNYNGQDVEIYKNLFDTIYNNGLTSSDPYNPYSAETVDKYIGVANVSNIYKMGLEKGRENAAKLSDNIEKAFGGVTDIRVGKFDDSSVSVKKLGSTQKKLYAIAKAMSQLGFNITVTNDASDTSKNGYYDPKSNSLMFNLSARYGTFESDNSKSGIKYMVNTIAHEVTHSMKVGSPKVYFELKTAIRQALDNSDKSWSRCVDIEYSRLVSGMSKEEAEKRSKELYEASEDEAIARACEDMLSDTDKMQEVLLQMDESTRFSVKDAIVKFFDRFRKIINDILKGYKSDSEEAKALRSVEGAVENIREIWLKGFAETAKAQRVLNDIGIELDGGFAYASLNNEKSYDNSMYVQNRAEAVNILHLATGRDESVCKKWLEDMDRVAQFITDNDILQYEEAIGKSAWVSNPEYGGSLDYSFLCPKRLVYTGTLNEILSRNKNYIPTVDDFLELRNILLKNGNDAPCSYCFVESARARFGKYNKEFIRRAKEELHLAYIPTAEDLSNPDILEKMKTQHPETYTAYEKYLNTLSQRKPKMLEKRRAYDGHVIRDAFKNDTTVKEKNNHGGIRFNSFSDQEVVHILDNMQAVLDMSTVGLAGFGYTKQSIFVKAFGQTGLKINLSCAAKGVDENGKIIFDDVEGMNSKEALSLRNDEKYSKNVGITCVVFTKEQLKAALADDRIDYVLPFHRSQWSKKDYERMGLSADTFDFTRLQNERNTKDNGKVGKKVKEGNIPFLTYWDFTKSGRENAQKYLDIINEKNLFPVFDSALEKENGKWILPEGAVGEGYYKCLVEFKMYDNDGNPSRQEGVVPNFDTDAIMEILESYEGGHEQFPVDMESVKDFEKYMKSGEHTAVDGRQFSGKVDEEYIKAVEEGDIDTAQKMVEEAALKAGARSITTQKRGKIAIKYYHGTNGSFNSFDYEKMKNGNYGYGFYLSPMESKASGYGKNLIEAYVMSDRMANKDSRNITPEMVEEALEKLGITGENREWLYADEGSMEEWVASTLDRNIMKDIERQAVSYTNYAPENILKVFTDVFGYDGMIFNNETVMFDNKKIKRSDAVTYDDNGNIIPLSERFNTSNNDIRYSSKVDSEYMDAVNSGDMEKAYNLVKTEAMSKGFSYHLYHGTKAFGFNRFDLSKMDDGTSIFLTDNIETAESYSGINKVRRIDKRLDTDYSKISFDDAVKEYNDINRENIKRVTKDNVSRYIEDWNSKIDQKGLVLKMVSDNPDVFSSTLKIPVEDVIRMSSVYKYYSEYKNSGDIESLETFAKEYEKAIDDISKNSAEMFGTLSGFVSLDVAIDYVKMYKSIDYRKNYAIDKYGIIQSEKYIRSYLSDRQNELYESNEGNYDVYAKIDNPLVIDCGGCSWDEIKVNNSLSKKLGIEKGEYKTRDISDAAKKSGYDGVVFEDIVDMGEDLWDFGESNVYVVFNPKNIKSADPVTYDENGDVIPLSDRFDTDSNDIRYSEKVDSNISDILGQNKRLAAENKKLRADVERLMKRINLDNTLTKGKVLSDNELGKLATTIRKETGSKISPDELVKGLKDVYGYIIDASDENKDITQDFEIDWDHLKSLTESLASDIVADIPEQVEIDPYYKKILFDIKKTKIKLSDEQIQEVKSAYGDKWRNAFLGKTTISKDGTSLDSMWKQWSSLYPDVFDENVNPNDQAMELLNVIDSVKEASEIVMEFDEGETIREMAENIYDKFWTLSRVVSKADRNADKIAQLNAQHRQTVKELKDSKKEAVEKQKLADQMYYGKIINDVRKQRDERIRKIQESARARRENSRTQAERRALIAKIDKNAGILRDWMRTNSAKSHVPDSMKPAVNSLLNAIDFSSKQLLGMVNSQGAFTPTRKDVSLANAMMQVNDVVQAAFDAQIDGDFQMDFPPQYNEDVRNLMETVNNIARAIGEDNAFVLQQMTLEELENLNNVVKIMKASVTQMNRLIASKNAHSVDYVAQKTIQDANKLGTIKVENGITNFFENQEILPYYFFKHLGEGGAEIFSELQDGWDKYAHNVDTLIKYTEDTYKSKEVNDWRNQVHEFEVLENPTEEERAQGIEGRTRKIKMNVPQIMSLYCLSKREQARGHIFGGGIRIEDFTAKGSKKVQQAEAVTLTNSELEKILGVLTKRQIAVADALQNFMNTTASEWGNEITMKRFGITGFTEKNYFPIKSDSNILSTDVRDDAQSIYRLLNLSFTKSLVHNANNQIIVGDVFSTFANHCADMAKYNAIALPVLDTIKWYNYKESEKRGETQKTVTSLKTQLEKAYGKGCLSYISHFLQDMNGSQENGRNENIIRKMTKNVKIASVGANVQVALLQPISYIRASYVMDQKYLMAGLSHKPQIEKCKKECGIALWKSLGFYDTNINRGLDTMITHGETVRDKIAEASMKMAEMGDSITWGYLYNAVEAEILDKTDLKKGTKEFTEALNRRFREIVYSTQVVDSTMTRSDIMRSKSAAVQSATSFMSEPTVSYNMLMDAYTEIARETKRTNFANAFKKHGRNVAKAAYAYTACVAVESVVRTAISLLRDPLDDDDEITEELWNRFIGYVADNINPLGIIPFGRDVVSIFQGYSVSKLEYSGIESSYYFVNEVKKLMNGKGSMYKAAYRLIQSASQLSGVPASAMFRDVVAVWNATVGRMYEDLKIQ